MPRTRRPQPVHFYPRPPRGGRRVFLDEDQSDILISIHALREEGDDHDIDRIAASGEISIHALREEGDLDSDIAQIIYKISIHALREEGDQRQPCIVAKLLYFYPRPP